MGRKTVAVKLFVLDEMQLDASFEELREYFNRIELNNPNHFDFRLNVDRWYDNIEFAIYASREETEEEFQKRIKRSQAAKRSAEKRKATAALKQAELDAKEYAEFVRLSKKFGKQ